MASCHPDRPHRTPELVLPVGMGAHCALRTSGDQLFLQRVRAEQLEVRVCVCVLGRRICNSHSPQSVYV